MKKTLLCAVFLPLVLNAQYEGRVGINTTTPQATLDISKVAVSPTMPAIKAQGVLFPELTTAERLAFSSNTKKGTLIYNKDKNCIEMYKGLINGVHEWTCTNTNAGSEISNPSAPATATLGAVQDVKLVVFKHNGKNYLVQGSNIMETGIAAGAEITVNIPYSGASLTNGAYTAYEQTLALKNGSGYMQDFKLSYPAGNFTGSSGTIPAKLKNVSGATYYPALAPEDGIYHNAISNANAYTISLNGSSTTTLKVQTLTGVPDRCFDKTTLECVGYGANEKEHEFIYVPIKGPDGRVWFSNNLGAEYARVGSSVFNPTQQATSKTDHNAYGSLFQWQRNPDGHELINWSGSNSGTPKYNNPTSSLSSSWENPNTNQFIYNSESSYSWVIGSVNSSGPYDLWQSSGAGKTNPCPAGYHVPTHAEQTAMHNAVLGYDAGTSFVHVPQMWEENDLRLPAPGFRGATSAILKSLGTAVYLWSSEVLDKNYVWGMVVWQEESWAGTKNPKHFGYSVRCLKD